MALVSITNLVYRYPDAPLPAIHGVSLDVEAGEWVLLQGVTGSGKSTLLKCISGACPAFYGGSITGTVSISGTPVSKLTPKLRVQKVGFVGQDPEAGSVYDIVEREVAFALENLGTEPSDMRWRVAEALELVGLSPLAKASVATLSGGQRQRLALAGALVHQPQLLLLDEPTSQLDPVSTNELFDLLKRLQQEYGVTILMSEHRLDSAYVHADRVVVLEGGRTVQSASPREVASQFRHTIPTQVPTVARLFPEEEQACLSVREARAVLSAHLSGLGLMNDEGEVATGGAPEPDEREVASDGTLGSGEGRVARGHAPGAEAKHPLVELRSVTTFYPGAEHPALHDCSVTIPAGGITAVVGPNGSGKSTLLRLLAGLQKADTGDIRWNAQGPLQCTTVGERDEMSHSVADRPKAGPFGRIFGGRRGRDTAALPSVEVAYLPQKPSDLFSQLSVEEELRYGLVLRGLDQSQIAARVDDATIRFDLGKLLNLSPRDVSGGEQLRVALASLWVTHPKLLLLDEPTRGLDAHQKYLLGELLQEMTASKGCTVLVVTHDMEFVAEFASEVVFLHGGAVAMQGPPRQVFANALVFAPVLARVFRPYNRGIYRFTDAVRAGWAK